MATVPWCFPDKPKRSLEMEQQNWDYETALLISNLRLQVHKLKAALMAAGVPAGTVERIAYIDGSAL